jgi:hypothetical protein
MPDIHIIPDDEIWDVKEADGSVVSAHDTQAEAQEVSSHRDDGEFSWIRKGEAV